MSIRKSGTGQVFSDPNFVGTLLLVWETFWHVDNYFKLEFRCQCNCVIERAEHSWFWHNTLHLYSENLLSENISIFGVWAFRKRFHHCVCITTFSPPLCCCVILSKSFAKCHVQCLYGKIKLLSCVVRLFSCRLHSWNLIFPALSPQCIQKSKLVSCISFWCELFSASLCSKTPILQ